MLLVTAPTVRAGLLSWRPGRPWPVPRGCWPRRPDHPLLPALDEAGIGWEVLPGAAEVLPAGQDAAGTARRLARAVAPGAEPPDRRRLGTGLRGPWCGCARLTPRAARTGTIPGPLALADELGGPGGPAGHRGGGALRLLPRCPAGSCSRWWP